MSRAIGGYVRRGDRRCIPPAPDDGIPRCSYCKARRDAGMWPHLCKEVTFQSVPSILPMIPFEVTGD